MASESEADEESESSACLRRCGALGAISVADEMGGGEVGVSRRTRCMSGPASFTGGEPGVVDTSEETASVSSPRVSTCCSVSGSIMPGGIQALLLSKDNAPVITVSAVITVTTVLRNWN